METKTFHQERNRKDSYSPDEVVEILNRYNAFQTALENYKRYPSVNNFGQAMLERIALDQVGPKIRIVTN